MEILFYKIIMADVSKIAPTAQAMEVADEMVKNAGGGIPKLYPCDEQGNIISTNPTASVTPITPKMTPRLGTDHLPTEDKKEIVYSTWTNTVVDDKAKQRIEAQHAVIEASGIKIDTNEQFFATGTRMAAEGYAAQERRKAAHDKKMLLTDAIEALTDTIDREMRRDIVCSAKDIARAINLEDNKLYYDDYLLSERAIRGIMTRINSPAIGYILGLQERISNNNTNRELNIQDTEKLTEIIRYECNRFSDVEFKLRARTSNGDIFAALSPSFGVADAPEVLEQIIDKMPSAARGSWSYDSDTTRWNLKASIWTPTPVAEQSVGEAFEGSIAFSSSDAGNGRFKGGGSITLLRCLNASTYTAGDGLSRVHRGKIMYDIATMIKKSLKAIDTLCTAWGKAKEEKLDIPTGLTLAEVIPGYFRYMLTDKRSDLQCVLKGRNENHVAGLTRTFYSERRNPDELVRSDLAQGFTRYIQNQPSEIRRTAEEAIGEWLVNRKPLQCITKE